MFSTGLLLLVLDAAIAGMIDPAVVCASAGNPAVSLRLAPGTALTQNSEDAAPSGWVSITGVRLTQGDAVQCPQVRDDAGVVHGVSYLSPDIPIGGRVTVRGFHAITPVCLGKVLVVEEEIKID